MNSEALYKAVEQRDARFAGRFFLGVRTTHIYCRPGCPAKTPRRENVQFFPSAAAAQSAGFRACMRCRPDAAPGSAAQAGTSAALSRALRLLEESGEAAGLADRLGMSDRHLRRLFAQHLGASPAEVLRTRRLHLARQLLDSSDLAMIDVAESAGFHSLRRFNDAIREAFGRTPSELRGKASSELRGKVATASGLILHLPFRPPLDFEALLGFFAPRALPGVEEVRDGIWRRTLREGILEVRARRDALEVRLPPVLAPQALQIAARVTRVFDLRADPLAIRRHLAKDELLEPHLRAGLRVPGAWDPFEMAVRAILGQQITVAAARKLAERLVQDYGETLPHGRLFPTAEKLAGVELTGMPASRARAVSGLAKAVAAGEIRLDGTQGAEALLEVPGIGDWTAQLIAMRALGEPDAFPAADLGLCKSLSLTPRELLARAEEWRPWRATAAAALWLSCGGDHDASR
jgi:AraC family transcriptional regulator, regulatory protein of adaptative response / DNA-3-methyladenine glycosylase II